MMERATVFKIAKYKIMVSFAKNGLQKNWQNITKQAILYLIIMKSNCKLFL